MRIRMLVGISGGRGDGTEWPAPGGEFTVGDEEGRELVQARLAVRVEEPMERAVAPAADVETRAPKSRSTRPGS
jgi:hypothetical protein